MDPDDSFSPPLDGLSRGNKLHQVLTTLSSADNIRDAQQQKNGPSGEIAGFIFVDDIIDAEEETEALGILTCNWWHMRWDPDWWKFEYIEVVPNGVIEEMAEQADDDEEPEEVRIEVAYSCGWYRQENDEVEGLTYYREIVDGEWESEPFDPDFESPKPLTRAVVDAYLPENIRSRYEEAE